VCSPNNITKLLNVGEYDIDYYYYYYCIIIVVVVIIIFVFIIVVVAAAAAAAVGGEYPRYRRNSVRIVQLHK